MAICLQSQLLDPRNKLASETSLTDKLQVQLRYPGSMNKEENKRSKKTLRQPWASTGMRTHQHPPTPIPRADDSLSSNSC